jgi:hypothetical protein
MDTTPDAQYTSPRTFGGSMSRFLGLVGVVALALCVASCRGPKPKYQPPPKDVEDTGTVPLDSNSDTGTVPKDTNEDTGTVPKDTNEDTGPDDKVGPEITVSTPLVSPFANLYLTGTVIDSGSGVKSVEVQLELGGNVIPVYPEENGEFSVLLAWKEGENDVEIVATDNAGNESKAHFTFTLDTKPPVVTLDLTTFKSEQNAKVEWNGADVTTTLAGDALTITISNDVCTPLSEGAIPAYQCNSENAPWHKLAHRLENVSGTPVTKTSNPNNLPYFQFDITDDNDLTVDYVLQHENCPLTPWQPAGKSGEKYTVPVTLPIDMQDLCEFLWTDDTMPNALRLRVLDAAGNLTEAVWRFNLQLLAPPVFLTEAQMENNDYTLNYFTMNPTIGVNTFNSANLHTLFQTGNQLDQQGGVRVAQCTVKNPYSIPLHFTFGTDSKLKVDMIYQQVYLLTDEENLAASFCDYTTCDLNSCATACGPDSDSCVLSFGDKAGQCLTGSSVPVIKEVDTQTYEIDLTMALYPSSNGLTALEPVAETGNKFSIGPDEELTLAVIAKTTVKKPSECIMAPPVKIGWPIGDKNAENPRFYVAPQPGDCPTGPTAVAYSGCNEYKNVPNGIDQCYVRAYATPKILLGAKIKANDSGKVAIQLTSDVPGLDGSQQSDSFEVQVIEKAETFDFAAYPPEFSGGFPTKPKDI